MAINHEAEAERLEAEAGIEAGELEAAKVGKDHTLLVVLLLVASILSLAFAYFAIVGDLELPRDSYSEHMSAKDRFELRGLFGDQWGAFTGIVSGLSFAFVALSLFAQRAELQMSRRELSMQRIELKYTRAQSHRQIAELRQQREEETRRALFEKEPIVLANVISFRPDDEGVCLLIEFDHFGPTACNLECRLQFGALEAVSLGVPQIVNEGFQFSHLLTDAIVGEALAKVEEDEGVEIVITTQYLNLTGGGYRCVQQFQASTFSLQSKLLGGESGQRKFAAVDSSFAQVLQDS